MKFKLRDNADRFSSEGAMISYILGRTGGKAAENFLPFFDEENGEALLKTANQVMEHLSDNYKDYNAYEKARIAFRDLKMSSGDAFMTFRIEFVKFAGKAKIKLGDYKRELYDKLPLRFNTICIDQYYDDNMTFTSFCDYINRYDY
ncbi:hypothetical protein F5Y18DRAFT_39305 [Xylariaceae sp. FL1019]|nr:hypothetical protein F5Y18DRAFT_39305 [Xylariaceae sp. FL1019]